MRIDELTEARPPIDRTPRSGMSVGREVYDLLWKNKMFKFDKEKLSDMREFYDIDIEHDADIKGMSFEDWAYHDCRDIRVSGAAGGTKYVNVQLLHMAPYLKDWSAAKALIEFVLIGPS